ncbi:MAG: hypothetical protein VXY44_05905 [Pseudomonadota bacterium]|nr:hypothetical protein [Pseudomonadota bacterium]
MTSIQKAGSLQVLWQRASHALRTGTKACLLFGFATMVHSQSSVPGVAEVSPLVPLAQQTDQQIGSLLQRWPELDAIQRRDLLAEVRKRMHLAKKVEANANNTGLQNRAPSLTLRIKKAQTQHRYGRVSNRPSGNLNDQNVSTPQNQSTKRDAPREMVIRTTVTQILPDGSRLVREQTLVPGTQPYRSSERLPASVPSSGNPVQNGAQPIGGDSAQPRSGKVRVIRTTVRFGAGFDQRSRRATLDERPKDGVRRIPTPQREILEQRAEGTEQ